LTEVLAREGVAGVAGVAGVDAGKKKRVETTMAKSKI
jgi:hypothetical protein